ncbi:DUF3298 and DUF4163 domain-containing protein [Halobacillus salinarum]|uniref:DUF3298 and DUF4163 domain-containing protein n=1 Tax=Halobacillus salinarum TaxID=2932257 RepID=A0ABY4EGU6_9BACI|nr:DUF3298 and DUF4163 domain-containing protein [Halobacillus salinarum]UOQ43672.1 DUF3298 and DUF4163 domain-containing protein [Halobacillus salinarum]
MKKNLCVLLSCMLVSGLFYPIQASSQYGIKHKDQVTQDWEVHVDYPIFQQLENKKLQNEINKKIIQKLEDTSREISSAAEEMNGFPVLYYEESSVIKNEEFYSVILTSHISKGNNYNSTVTSINFMNQSNGKVVGLKDLFQMEELNKQVRKELAKEPDTYFTKSFAGVRENTAFYIRGKLVTLIFNKFEIAPGVYGTPEIQIPLERLKRKDNETYAPFPSIT